MAFQAPCVRGDASGFRSVGGARPFQNLAGGGLRKRPCTSVGVLSPSKPDSTTNENERNKSQSKASVERIMRPVVQDVDILNSNLRNVVGERHPMLMAAADQIFGAGGKKLRPAIVFLVARATMLINGTSDLTEKQKRLAEITEMIHTASLVHDDVLDDCDIRRGKTTVNSLYGTRVAVLAGDFLFAQASWGLANLENIEVIKLISQVIADFANGEITQATSLFDVDITMEKYLDKNFYKTASLIAASCKSATVFSDVSEDVKEAMYMYGKHMGQAYQIVDDILDFTQSTEQLGKPQGQDLRSGNLTAPAIFALQSEPELRDIIENEFTDDGSLERALVLVKESGGIDQAMELAREEAEKARGALACLPESPAKESLELMIDFSLQRLA